MAVAVMICYARSGGTVLNQCLGSLPQVVILSEVNPLGGGSGKGPVFYRTVKSQASQWYGIEVKSDDFAEGILELHEICQARGLHLVMRDWSFVNFAPQPENGFAPPNRLLTLEALQGKCELRAFAFVRDAIDVWLSRSGAVNDFFTNYLRYVKVLLEHKVPIFKYEAFCRAPDSVLREICRYAGLEFNESYLSYEAFERVNGDVQLLSRGIQQHSIRPLRRKRADRKNIQELNHCSRMIEANRLLGYPIAYAAVPCENLLIRAKRASRRLLRIERLKQIASFARLGGSAFDRLNLAIIGYARGHPLKSTGVFSAIGHLLFRRVIVRPIVLGAMKVQLDPSDLGDLVSFQEIVADRSYDLSLVPFDPEVILDCGAHIALFSLLARNRYPNAKIIAFEPNPRNIEVIERHLRLNKTNISVVPAAVSTTYGKRRFSAQTSNTGSLDGAYTAVSLDSAEKLGESYEVDVVDLRSVILKMKIESLLLKVDIEGEERNVLPAVIPILPKNCAIFLETHNWGRDWAVISKRLQDNGFRTKTIRARGQYIDAFAWRA